ncbi:hypothetical protein CONLIGDRAFT_668573 [Coniochaeta ligniaria NRRL 30616]|uniref:Pre-mRNA-splicing factor 38B n=1 Tax=Coniochaeta ligniaria NRRL 30616 TaxID=1408157 RepID=A0A1J7ITV3_9PEZI|nr:hypothetical protein CONLIGDRAFT_668573 [Coniochaeta ligniaria NRRL 30616]
MDTLLTDDHVAEMLAKEASDYSLRHSSMGLDAFRSARPAAKAKPNIRFLHNIIKETKSHNEALLAKEAAEAQARLDSLAAAKAREERKHRPGAQDLRRRQLGAITATLQGKKRKVEGGEGDECSARKRAGAGVAAVESARLDRPAERAADKESGRDRHRGRDGDRGSERRHRRTDRSLSPDESERRHRKAGRSPSPDDGKVSRKRSRPDRSRSRSPGYRERKHRSHRSHRYRDRSPSEEAGTDKRSSPHRKHRSSRHHDDNRDTSPSGKHHHKRRESPPARKEKQDDSDPLEEIIGPLPPQIRRKGRGAATGPSAMDSRFSADYDPKSDVLPDSDLDGDDWADSLEALRDREKWRLQGAERLRAAGFTEEQVRGWEKGDGGREKGVEDVRWAKEGEGREWDRGKVVGTLD